MATKGETYTVECTSRAEALAQMPKAFAPLVFEQAPGIWIGFQYLEDYIAWRDENRAFHAARKAAQR